MSNVIVYLLLLLLNTGFITCIYKHSDAAVASSQIVSLASVDNMVITSYDLEKYYIMLNTIFLPNINHSLALDLLIENYLSAKEAENLGIIVNQDEIAAELKRLMQYREQTTSVFQDTINKSNIEITDIEQYIRNKLLFNKILKQHLNNNENIINDEFLEKKQMFVNNKKWQDSQVDTIISLAEIAKLNTIENISIISEVYNKLKNGENFSSIAKNFSTKSSSAFGGDIGFIKMSELSKKYQDMLLNLKEGDFTKPFICADHIIILLVKKKMYNNKLVIYNINEEEETKFKLLLMKRKREMLAKNILMDLRQKYHIEIF